MEIMRRRTLSICSSSRVQNSWAIDYDYLAKLSQKELEFLASFTQFFYHGNPHKCGAHLDVSDSMKTESYTRSNASKRDASNLAIVWDRDQMNRVADGCSEDYLLDYIDNADTNRILTNKGSK